MASSPKKNSPPRLSEANLRLVGGIGLNWVAKPRPFLKPRFVGSEGHREVRDHILSSLRNLKAPWQIELDTFEDDTPIGRFMFQSIVATLDPRAPRRLTLVAHYDSKHYLAREWSSARDKMKKFLGATDSAVPCAMLLDIA
eukprot:UC4_evm1s1460